MGFWCDTLCEMVVLCTRERGARAAEGVGARLDGAFGGFEGCSREGFYREFTPADDGVDEGCGIVVVVVVVVVVVIVVVVGRSVGRLF